MSESAITDEQKTQLEIMNMVDRNAGYGFRIVGRMPRVKVYMTHLTRFKRREPELVGTFKTKRAAHKKISEICNPKPKKEKKVQPLNRMVEPPTTRAKLPAKPKKNTKTVTKKIEKKDGKTKKN